MLRLRAGIGCLLLCGCGGESNRLPVAGVVTMDGQPMPAGAISFEPTTTGIGAGATIQNGAYEIPQSKGPTPGKYKVRINYTQPTGRTLPDPRGGDGTMPEMRESVPARYNSRSELMAELVSGGVSSLNFELKGK